MSEGGWKARYLGRRPVDGPLNDYKLTSVVTSLQQEQKTRKGKGVTTSLFVISLLIFRTSKSCVQNACSSNDENICENV
jgi:hypothetical protein